MLCVNMSYMTHKVKIITYSFNYWYSKQRRQKKKEREKKMHVPKVRLISIVNKNQAKIGRKKEKKKIIHETNEWKWFTIKTKEKPIPNENTIQRKYSALNFSTRPSTMFASSFPTLFHPRFDGLTCFIFFFSDTST